MLLFLSYGNRLLRLDLQENYIRIQNYNIFRSTTDPDDDYLSNLKKKTKRSCVPDADSVLLYADHDSTHLSESD